MVAAALYWFTFLRRSVVASPPEWLLAPLGRLHPIEFVFASLGGLRHVIELVVVVSAVVWILAALISRRRDPWWGCDRHLLALCGLFFLLYFLLPDKYSTTMRFSSRWGPFILLALLLAVGRPSLRRGLRRTLALVVVASFMAVTAVHWLGFEANELDGLPESLAAIEGEPRVVGLSYLSGSRYFRGQPFVQTFAWTYAVHGGMLNFSFGDNPLNLVVYTDPDRFEWTEGLEWVPKAIRRSDFQYFDYALVGGDERAHATMLGVGSLTPLVSRGVWRLYRVESEPGPAAAGVVAPPPTDSSEG